MTDETAPIPRHVLNIQAAAAALHRHRRAASLVAVLLAVLVFLATGIRIVRNDERGLRRRFGKLVDGRVPPGATFVVPLVEELEVVSVGTVRAIPLSKSESQPLEFVTGDENLVEIAGQLQYRIEDAGLFRTAQGDPSGVLVDSAVSTLAREISTRSVDEVLTSGKSAIQEAVRSATQAAAERSGTGIVLLQVSLSSVAPPQEAAEAFNAVSDAAAGRERRVSEAQGRSSQALSLARADAEKAIRQAESEKKEVTEAARGAKESFLAIANEVARSPGSSRARLYRESVSKILQRARVIALLPGSRIPIRLFLGQLPTGDFSLKSLPSILGSPPPSEDAGAMINPSPQLSVPQEVPPRPEENR